MHSKLKELLVLSGLEVGRIKAPNANPGNISAFSGLESLVTQSLKAPTELVRTQTLSGVPLRTPQTVKRPFHDEALMEKLLKYRSQIPISARIIRATES